MIEQRQCLADGARPPALGVRRMPALGQRSDSRQRQRCQPQEGYGRCHHPPAQSLRMSDLRPGQPNRLFESLYRFCVLVAGTLLRLSRAESVAGGGRKGRFQRWLGKRTPKSCKSFTEGRAGTERSKRVYALWLVRSGRSSAKATEHAGVGKRALERWVSW
jgi:hypothetical protein